MNSLRIELSFHPRTVKMQNKFAELQIQEDVFFVYVMQKEI